MITHFATRRHGRSYNVGGPPAPMSGDCPPAERQSDPPSQEATQATWLAHSSLAPRGQHQTLTVLVATAPSLPRHPEVLLSVTSATDGGQGALNQCQSLHSIFACSRFCARWPVAMQNSIPNRSRRPVLLGRVSPITVTEMQHGAPSSASRCKRHMVNCSPYLRVVYGC